MSATKLPAHARADARLGITSSPPVHPHEASPTRRPMLRPRVPSIATYRAQIMRVVGVEQCTTSTLLPVAHNEAVRAITDAVVSRHRRGPQETDAPLLGARCRSLTCA